VPHPNRLRTEGIEVNAASSVTMASRQNGKDLRTAGIRETALVAEPRSEGGNEPSSARGAPPIRAGPA